MARGDSRRGRGEGALFFDANKNRWVGRITIDGERRKVLATTKTEARRRLDELRNAAASGLPITPGDITLGELLRLWEQKGLASRSISDSQRAAHRWAINILTADLGSRRLRSLRPDHLEHAFTKRAEGTATVSAKRGGRGRSAGSALSRESLIKIRSTLNQALTWAQRRDLIARNIAPLVELPAAAAPRNVGRSMTREEAIRFLEAASESEFEAMWLLMLFLGLRPGEAAAVSWGDVDFDNGTVHIWRGRKIDTNGAAVVGSTKTPGSIRSLDAPAIVLDALARHRTRQTSTAELVGTEWRNGDDLVFTSPLGRPTDPKAVRNEFQRVAARARLDGRWTPNLLRHTAASLMADAGMPIEQVADQLGHRDLRMLQRHYRHRLRPTINGGHVLGNVLHESS